MKNFENEFKAVCSHARHAAVLQSIADVLEWDERTGLPSSAGEYRSTQISLIRTTVHAHLTDEAFGNRLHELSESISEYDPHSHVATTVRELLCDWQRNRKLPVDLVKRLSEARVLGQQVWDAARKADDFSKFASVLREMISLKREEGTLLSDGGDPYEALLNEYEPGTSVQSLATMFEGLRNPLAELVGSLNAAKRKPDVHVLQRSHAIEGQRKLSRYVAEAIGFDFSRGRLDETSHPFCTSLGPDDCRILSRYEETWLPAGLFGAMHEAGHGIYEQGLDPEWYGLPPGSYASLGIHESQSRLWENQVGRSFAFWKWLMPKAKEFLGSSLGDVSAETMYAAVNVVQPSLIRVEADEATYNLHIIIRFELEKALLSGALDVADLPGAWDDAYENLLGVRSPSAADGVLQDVHWSAGLFGYFPTYTLGNLAAAQLFRAAENDISHLDNQIGEGNFDELKNWLWTHIYRHGKCWNSQELVENATGTPLAADAILSSLKARCATFYS